MGNYIKNFKDDTCEFEIYTDDLALESANIPMMLEITPMYGPEPAEHYFNIIIQGACGEVLLDPVEFVASQFQVNLWNTLDIGYEPFFAEI